MIDWDKELDEVFGDPLFDDVKVGPRRQTSSDRIVQSFQKVLAFFNDNGRLPSADATDFEEKALYMSWKGIVDNPANISKCRPFDTLGILPADGDIASEPETKYGVKNSSGDPLDDIFNDPLFADAADTSALFDIPDFMAKKMAERAEADYIGSRKPCEDFAHFEAEFKEIKEGLSNGTYRLIKFHENNLKAGRFFVEDGILLKVEAISGLEKNRQGRTDGRLRIIYDNGMESDVKYRTLTKNLAATGYSLQRATPEDKDFLEKSFTVTEEDVFTGYIYVLRSKSTDPEIASRKNLYKIGFTATSMESRLAGASKESTYLCAPVEIVNTWKVFNVKSSTLEALIHKLFAQVQFHVKVNNDTPKEWYVVPYHIIEKAVKYIVAGVPVAYDHNIQQLVELA